MLKFNKHKAMNERIIDRKLFVDLAKEVGLNASHIEAMGEMRQGSGIGTYIHKVGYAVATFTLGIAFKQFAYLEE